MKLLWEGVFWAAIFTALLVATGVWWPDPAQPAPAPPHAILVTYCGKIPVGVILTTDPPQFIPYAEMDDPALNAAVPADRISHFDLCPAKTDV